MRINTRLPYSVNQVLITPTIQGGLTLTEGGTIATTLNGDITLAPHGTGSVIGAGGVDTSKVITFDTSLYERIINIPILACGVNAATPAPLVETVINHLLGRTTNQNNIYLHFPVIIERDWDGVSNPWIRVYLENNQAAGGEGAHSYCGMVFKYKTIGQTIVGTQSAVYDYVWGTAAECTVLAGDFIIDWDLASNILVAPSVICGQMNIDTGGSDIDHIRFIGASLHYLTKEIAQIAAV